MVNIVEKNITNLVTIRTQAFTKYYADINDVEEFKEVGLFAKQNNLKIQILGNGTNILFTRELYEDTLFIKLGNFFSEFTVYEDYVEIGGAFSFIRAGKKLIDLGYSDFVYMTLIPGSLGGGIRQNAGTTKEGEVKDNFISATLYDFEAQKIVEFDNVEMDFKYRNSILCNEKNRYVVLSAKFDLGIRTDDVESLKNFVKEKQKAKKSKQPSGHTFGSTFKSLKYPKQAWWYIDQVDLRGYVIGGAKFSNKHSNWILNDNKACADDILNLIAKAKSEVYEKFNISLEIEVELI